MASLPAASDSYDASSLPAGTAPRLVHQRTHDRSAQAPRLEFARELRDDVPAASSGGPSEGSGERILDGWHLQIRWPKRDHVTRTYVNSRSVVRT